MTSARQKASNRRNAERSTGPRSADGKAMAAQNARRHGLTAAPPEAEVQAWLRIILNRPVLPPAKKMLWDEGLRRARRLAEAEARLAAVRSYLMSETGSLENGDPEDAAFEETRKEMRALFVATRNGKKSGDQAWAEAQVVIARQKQYIRLSKHGPRYVAEAQGARRRALKDWVEWQCAGLS
jgi:hypothetical protein